MRSKPNSINENKALRHRRKIRRVLGSLLALLFITALITIMMSWFSNTKNKTISLGEDFYLNNYDDKQNEAILNDLTIYINDRGEIYAKTAGDTRKLDFSENSIIDNNKIDGVKFHEYIIQRLSDAEVERIDEKGNLYGGTRYGLRVTKQ